jgi:hypothetical protein
MRVLTVPGLLIAAMLPAQEQAVRERPVPPERQKAPENALRNLRFRSLNKPGPNVERKALTLERGDVACGYIRVVPADPAIDSRMPLPVPQGHTKDERMPRQTMPVYEGLPPCELPAGN